MKKNNLPLSVLALSLAAFLLFSCNAKNSQHQKGNMNHTEHSHKKHMHSGHGFSDQAKVEELAKKFESAERDSTEQPQKIIRFMGDMKGKTLMDIGAGTGYYSVKFAGMGAYVIAADASAQFQHYLKNRVEKNNINNIELRKVPYDNPLLKEHEVDIVFIANTYHHIDNRTDYLKHVKKGLKVNGELVIVDYFSVDLPKHISAPPMEMRVSVDQVLSELKTAGFTHFETEVNLLPYQYIIRAK